jgi:hypothetical protein
MAFSHFRFAPFCLLLSAEHGHKADIMANRHSAAIGMYLLAFAVALGVFAVGNRELAYAIVIVAFVAAAELRQYSTCVVTLPDKSRPRAINATFLSLAHPTGEVSGPSRLASAFWWVATNEDRA